MKKRARIVSGLAALAALFLAPIAEASLSRVSAAERAIEAPSLTLTEAAPEPSDFSLFEGTELTDAAAESESQQSFHPLAAVPLLDERAQRDLATPLELSYPKTRYRVFGLLGTPIFGELRGVTLELHWRSASFSCGFASGTVGWLSQDPMGTVDSVNLYGFVGMRPHEKTDPLGLAIPVDEVWDAVSLLVDFGFAGYEWATEGKVSPATRTAIGIDLTALMIPYIPGGGALARVTGGAAVMASSAAKTRSGVRAAQGATKGLQITHQLMRSHSGSGSTSGEGSSSGSGSGDPSAPKPSAEETRAAIELSRHRAGNRQLQVGDQRWNVPKGADVSKIPSSDIVGDQLQRSTTEAAQHWNRSLMSQNEMEAFQKALTTNEPWKAQILESQAKGRWVESQVRAKFPHLTWSRTGVDAINKETGVAYEILSGSKWNVGKHMRRMPDTLFRLITF